MDDPVVRQHQQAGVVERDHARQHVSPGRACAGGPAAFVPVHDGRLVAVVAIGDVRPLTGERRLDRGCR